MQQERNYRLCQRIVQVIVFAILLSPYPMRRAEAQNASAQREAFQQAWTFTLEEPVRLIEVASLTPDKQARLALLVGGRDRNDYRRRLVVCKWNGVRFAEEWRTEFQGAAEDVLLTGPFRTASVETKLPSDASPPAPDKGKSATPVSPRPRPVGDALQLVVSGGIFEWTNGTFARLFDAPPGIRLALLRGKQPALLLIGTGDSAVAYAVDEVDAHVSAQEPPQDGEGYVKSGYGTQEFPGVNALNVAVGVRFLQSYWEGRNRWFIGLAKGSPAPTDDDPDATSGDRVVVYMPKRGENRSFWQTDRTTLQEVWRSPNLGRVLDVRIGDPKNEGKPGLVVLSSSGTDARLTLSFYVPGR